MGSLLHPIGSQPPWVYWARRAAVVVAVLLVAGGLWVLIAQPGGTPIAAEPAAQTPSGPTAPQTSVTPTVKESTTPTASPSGPVMCDETNASISLAGYQKVKQGGKQAFRVGVGNRDSANCVLDLKPANFEFTVTSGTDRIWTTADCPKWVPAKKQSLKPQQAHEFTIEWPLRRSATGCKVTKDALRPGTYVGTATFADGLKARQVFTIVKK